MSKKQTRRTVSLNRRVFEAAKSLAEREHSSLSSLVEALLLVAISDEQLTAEVMQHRAAEKQRTAARPAVAPRPPGKRGRPIGRGSTCSACGELGHNANPDGLCSRSYLAALYVANHGGTITDAAAEHGVHCSAVSLRLKAMGVAVGNPHGGPTPDPNSKSRRAALLVLDEGRRAADAAMDLGISRAAVHDYVARVRRERAASVVA